MVHKIDRWIVSLKDDQKRLVLFLKEKTQTSLSNRMIKNALERGCCKVNDIVETYASRKLRKGDRVQIQSGLIFSKAEKKEDHKIKKLYEDDYFIFIDKHSGFLSEDKEIDKYFPGCMLVHRLDKQTSGVLLLAKSKLAKNKMKDLFIKKLVHKSYIAVVDGKVKENKQKKESFLIKRKDLDGKILWKESKSEGLFSISVFETLKRKTFYSVLRCSPITGRTHQLRVHLSSLGHPILGDYQYCLDFKYPKFVSRLMLHSYEMEFIHPFLEKKIKVKAPLPKEFKYFIEKV